jgi:cysteine-rich repeat protein
VLVLSRLQYVVWCVLVGCAQPTFVSCPDGEQACGAVCADVAFDNENCGACDNACDADSVCTSGICVSQIPSVCSMNNGGCSPQALCMDIGGTAECLCMPGFTGTGQQCAACTACDSSEFTTAPCMPTTDTVCAACSAPCGDSSFESQPCGALGDRVCSACTTCQMGTYFQTFCAGSQDTVCAPCETGCLGCSGPGASCFECDIGLVLSNGMCLPAVCSNGIIESGEECDDGNAFAADGCSDQCQVEAGSYCFGGPSTCRAGGCVVEPAMVLPLGADFVLEGNATPSGNGLTFAQRSTIRTAVDVEYPILVEADVVYSGADVTYAGARGVGTPQSSFGDEPMNTVHGRLDTATGSVDLVEADGSVISNTTAPFTPTPGVTYRVRYVDDGLFASVEWFNLTNPSEGVGLQMGTSYHGAADKAFVGGGAMTTVSNIRACSAPTLPVTTGLVARYSAIPSWTAVRDLAQIVSQWQDISGNGNDLNVDGTGPAFSPGLINTQRAALDFTGGGRLSTAPFALTTDVTVFAVVTHRAPGQWGAIAHHGSRDNDWSMEQSGDTGNPDTLHWQTNNDNVNMDLTLAPDTSYILAGRFEGNARYFSATAFAGSSPAPVSIVDVSHSITAGSKQLFVGSSDNNEPSNAFVGDLVYYNRALSDAERDAVIDYLRRLWPAL